MMRKFFNHGLTRIGSLTLPGFCAGASRQLKKGQALAQTIRVIRGLTLAMVSAAVVFPTLAAAPTISVTAQQRYPWNGLVDIAFTITGESGVKYDTSFIARDVAGGTNLTMKTIYKSDGSAAALTNQLAAGSYKWVWNAAADLSSGFNCERVAVTGNVAILGYPAVSNGLVAWWPFDGDIKDHSGNGHHLSGTASYVTSRAGASNAAASFTGSSFLTQQTNLGVSGALTISCWVCDPTYTIPQSDIDSYLQAIGYGNFGHNWCYFPLIIFPVQYSSIGRGIGLSVAKNRIDVFANGIRPARDAVNFNVFLDYALTVQSGWHHVAVTVGKSATPILYYDGVKVATGSDVWNGSQVYLNSGSSVGGGYVVINGGNNARNYKGKLDDLVIYNRILTASEISTLYTTGK